MDTDEIEIGLRAAANYIRQAAETLESTKEKVKNPIQ